METIKSLTDKLRREQLSQIRSRYDTEISRLGTQHTRKNSDYADRLRGSYIAAMEGLRDLPQQLAAKGLWGGITRTESDAIIKKYRNESGMLEGERNKEAADYKTKVAREIELRDGEINEFHLKNALADLKAQRSGGSSGGGGGSTGGKAEKPTKPKTPPPRNDGSREGEDTPEPYFPTENDSENYKTGVDELMRYIQALLSRKGTTGVPSGRYHMRKDSI